MGFFGDGKHREVICTHLQNNDACEVISSPTWEPQSELSHCEWSVTCNETCIGGMMISPVIQRSLTCSNCSYFVVSRSYISQITVTMLQLTLIYEYIIVILFNMSIESVV